MGRLLAVHRGVLVAVALAAAAACGSGEIVPGVSDSTFVAALADLQRIQGNAALDSAAREAARRRALQGRGLTAEALDRAARALADDPRRARELLLAVRARLTAAPDSSAPAPARDSAAR